MIWTNTGIPWAVGNTDTYSMATHGGNLYVGSHNDAGGQVWSFNGSAWANTNIPWTSGNQYTNALASYGGKLYAGSYYYAGTSGTGQIWSLNGSTWANANIPWSGAEVVGALIEYNSKLYAGGYISGGGGQTWSFDGSTWANASSPSGILDFAIYGSTLYAAAAGGGVLTYNGSSWSTLRTFSGIYDTWSLAIHNGSLFVSNHQNSGVGLIWEYNFALSTWYNTGIESYWSATMSPSMVSYDGKLYVAGNDGSVWSLNGSSWTNESAPAWGMYLSVYNSKLYQGGGQVWYTEPFASPSPSASTSRSMSPSLSPSSSPSTLSLSLSPSLSRSPSSSRSMSPSPSRSPSQSTLSISPSLSQSALSPSLSPSVSLSLSLSLSQSTLSISPSPSQSVRSLSPSPSPSLSLSESPSPSLSILSPSVSPSILSPTIPPPLPSVAPEPLTTTDLFLADLMNRRGAATVSGNANRLGIELNGGYIVEMTPYEPDANTYRQSYYYNTVTNSLMRKVIVETKPVVVAYWKRISS
jgi:hypothetical protein